MRWAPSAELRLYSPGKLTHVLITRSWCMMRERAFTALAHFFNFFQKPILDAKLSAC